MMTNVMVKTCLNQKIIKISNLIQAMKNSVCPKAKVMRRPKFSKAEFVRIFTECSEVWIEHTTWQLWRVDWTHDVTIVKGH